MSKPNLKLTFSQKLAELDQVLAWFESEDFEIEQALDKYQQAEKLVAELEHDLTIQKNKIIKL